MHLSKIIALIALIAQTPCELRNNPSCLFATEQKGLGWRRNIFISLTEYIRPVSGLGYCRCLRLRWAPGILQTCLMWPFSSTLIILLNCG